MNQDHLFVSIEHCQELKTRSRDTIDSLEAAIAGSSQRTSPMPVITYNSLQRSSKCGATRITSQAVSDSIAVALASFPAGPSSTAGNW